MKGDLGIKAEGTQ